MEEFLNKETFDINGTKIRIIHKKLELHLRTSFGTSHSSTTVRNNSLIKIDVLDQKDNVLLFGLGESGLPPKKAHCYLADQADIKEYISGYFNYLHDLIKQNYSAKIQDEVITEDLPQYIHTLIYALDTCPLNNKDFSKASRNCIEGAILDICGKIKKVPLYSLLHLEYKENKPTFYTVGISDDEESLQSLTFGLKYTHYIKIKLNKDIERSRHILDLIFKECHKIPNYNGKWSLDLNSDFNDPEICLKLIREVLVNYKDIIYMIEQPFPIIVDCWEKWKKVKEESEKLGMFVFADESVNTVDSIEPIKDVVSGINIKLEKCGGLRGALKCIKKANELGLKIWIGCMVGSSLLMNVCAGITPAAIYSDLDGELLVNDETQPCKDGFAWDLEKGVIILSKLNGVGVTLKDEFKL